MNYVIDTDIAIDYMKGKEDIVEALDSFPELFVTAVTVAELFYGAYNSAIPEKSAASVIRFLESVNILDVTFSAAYLFGKIKADLGRSGRTVGDFDLLIAGTCITNRCTLITGNRRHYQHIDGLNVESI